MKKLGNRAIVFLVETSDLKKPEDDSLGGSKKVFSSAKYRPFLFSLLQ